MKYKQHANVGVTRVQTGVRVLIGQRSVVVRQTGRPHADDARASRPCKRPWAHNRRNSIRDGGIIMLYDTSEHAYFTYATSHDNQITFSDKLK